MKRIQSIAAVLLLTSLSYSVYSTEKEIKEGTDSTTQSSQQLNSISKNGVRTSGTIRF